MSYVYVFDFGDMVKVGVSIHPLQRLREIQKANGIKAVRTWAVDAEEFAKEIELAAHVRLCENLVQGNEYFRCSFATARNAVIDLSTDILGHAVSGVRVGGVAGQAQKEATARYNKKAYDRIDLIVPKGKRQAIADYAKSKGVSTNKFINEAIDRAMKEKEDGL